MRMTTPALWVLMVVVGLAGCKTQVDNSMDKTTDPCGAAALQHLVGQSESAFDATAQTGPVRILPPGSAMTMDHRPDRLNLDLDGDGVITRIWCG